MTLAGAATAGAATASAVTVSRVANQQREAEGPSQKIFGIRGAALGQGGLRVGRPTRGDALPKVGFHRALAKQLGLRPE